MMKKRIAQVVCVFPPYRGGIGMIAYNHAKSMAQRGHEVVVFVPKYNKDEVDEEREGFKIKRLEAMFTFGNAGFCPTVANELKDFDVVHLHVPCFGVAEFAIKIKKINPKVKLVVTYHMDVVGGLVFRPYFWFYSKFILPRIIKAADTVIVTSNDYAAHSQIRKQFYSIPNKFYEIPPEVDLKHFYKRDFSEFKDKLNINGEKVILFVGGMDSAHYFKGLNVLLESFAILLTSSGIKAKLVLVGSGNLQPSYLKKAKDLAIDSEVIFAGNVSHEDLPYCFSMSQVFVLPSIDKSEAFGIVLLEAQACGVPLIASNLPGVRTVIVEGKNGFTVPVKNQGQLAARLQEILSNDSLIDSFGQFGIEQAQKLYNSEIVASKLEEIYNS